MFAAADVLKSVNIESISFSWQLSNESQTITMTINPARGISCSYSTGGFWHGAKHSMATAYISHQPQVIIIVSLLVLNLFIKDLFNELTWLHNMLSYYRAASLLYGQPWTQLNNRCVAMYKPLKKQYKGELS
jgi:hypothetical protein